MALQFIEGFDDGLMIPKGWQGTWTPTTYPDIVAGRFGGKAMKTAYIKGGVYYLAQPLSGAVIVGFAVQPSMSAYTVQIAAFDKAGLYIQAGGALALYRNDTNVQIAVSAKTIWPTGGIWRYLELKYDTTTGACEVRVDGVTAVSGTVPTTSAIGSIKFPNTPNSKGEFLIDDLYIADSTSTINNDFLGDVRVSLLLPSADGTYQDMVPSSGTSHYSLVNDATPDTTSYVSTPNVGARDTYQFPDLSNNTAGVFGLRVTSYSQKDGTGSAGIRNVARISGADYQGVTVSSLSVSWTANSELWESNPATGQLWSVSDVDDAEFGIETA